MENFKTGRPIGHIVWPLILVQALIGVAIYFLLKKTPQLSEFHALVGPLSLVFFLVMVFWCWLFGTHPPYFIKVTKTGLLAIKLSGSRIPWAEIVRIEQDHNQQGQMGVNFYLRSKEGSTDTTFLRLDGYEASPEEIWQGLEQGFKAYKRN